MHLIIDEGNTRVKLATFKNGKLVDIEYASVFSCQEDINRIVKSHKIEAAILSSVTDDLKSFFSDLKLNHKVILSFLTTLPFKIAYKTPKTLGVDRIALIAAAWFKFPNEASLVIDAGTCITYDFIDASGVYHGGAIAPGLSMRFKSMHYFTKKLPELSISKEQISLIGRTTKESMESGVLNGTVFEIDGTIQTYQQKYGKVNIILTGGDAKFLDKRLKNSIFVNPKFLLEGLNEVLTYQTNR